MADDSEFALGPDNEGKPSIFWQGELLGALAKGRTFMQPAFVPVKAVSGLEGDALREITARAEAWIEAQLAKAMGGIVGLQELAQQADIDGNVRALAVRLADEGGIAGRHYLADAIAALPKEARGAARKGGIVFGALDIYHHAALKPAAAKWRAALFAAREGRPMPELPPESAVHLKDWRFAHPGEARNAGYRRIGDEYVRIDLAERVIKKAHEARGQANLFGMDMAFATSLGISEAGLKALMRDAGFRPADAPVAEVEEAAEPPPHGEGDHPQDGGEVPEGFPELQTSEPLQPAPPPPLRGGPPPRAGEVLESPASAQPVVLTHWRWIGLPKPRPQEQRQRPARPERPKPRVRKAEGQARPCAACAQTGIAAIGARAATGGAQGVEVLICVSTSCSSCCASPKAGRWHSVGPKLGISASMAVALKREARRLRWVMLLRCPEVRPSSRSTSRPANPSRSRARGTAVLSTTRIKIARWHQSPVDLDRGLPIGRAIESTALRAILGVRCQ